MESSDGREARAKYHSGPDYGACPSGTYPDTNCVTWDTGRGGTMINWVDLFSKEHKVDFASNPSSGSVTVCFPISHGGSWNWQDANAREGKS